MTALAASGAGTDAASMDVDRHSGGTRSVA